MNPYIELPLLLVLTFAAYCLGRIRGVKARLACGRVPRLVWATTSNYLHQTWGSEQTRARAIMWNLHTAALEFLQHGKVEPNLWGKPVKGISRAADKAASIENGS